MSERRHCWRQWRQRDHDRELRQRLRERGDCRISGYYVAISARLPYTPVLPYSLLGRSTTLSAQSMIRIR